MIKKTLQVDSVILTRYCSLLEKTVRDIDSIVHEYDHEIIHNSTEKVPQDIRFDVIPMIRKLQLARKEALTSLDLFSRYL